MTIEELRQIILNISGYKEVSSLIESQIKKLVEEGYSYKEIARCLCYFYEVLKNDTSKLNTYGIGIVRNVRTSANAYYDNIKLKQEQQLIAAKQAKEQESNIQVREIKPCRRNFRKKGVDLDEL